MSLLVLARLAVIELWRQKLAMLAIGLAGLMALMVFLPEAEAAFEVRHAFTYDIGVTILPFFGIFVGVLAGGGLIAGEFERGTALLLATKPVSRAGIVAGKALGAFAFILGAFALWAGVLTLVSALRYAPAIAVGVGVATLAGALVPCLYAAIAIAASTRLPATGAIGAGGLAWFAVVISGGLLQVEEFGGAASVHAAAKALRWAIPAEHLAAWPTLITTGTAPTAVQLVALLAIPAWLALAAVSFASRDLA